MERISPIEYLKRELIELEKDLAYIDNDSAHLMADLTELYYISGKLYSELTTPVSTSALRQVCSEEEILMLSELTDSKIYEIESQISDKNKEHFHQDSLRNAYIKSIDAIRSR